MQATFSNLQVCRLQSIGRGRHGGVVRPSTRHALVEEWVCTGAGAWQAAGHGGGGEGGKASAWPWGMVMPFGLRSVPGAW